MRRLLHQLAQGTRRLRGLGVGAALLMIATLLAPPQASAVVHGTPVEEPGSVVALLRADGATSGGDQDAPASALGQICGGTAIAEDLVLTAAHCFHDGGTLSRRPDDVVVIAGRVDLTAEGGTESVGTELYVHPAYDGRRSRHDVAVLRVGQPLGVPAQVLAEADAAVIPPGTRTRILGWGRTADDAPRPTTLHHAVIRVSASSTCLQAYEGTVDPAVHVCAGSGGTEDDPAADACTGDSGGPLLLDESAATGVQVGITSFGPETCGVGDPGVYTRVDVVRPFVDDVVAGDVEPTASADMPTEPQAANVLRIASGDGTRTEVVAQAVSASSAVFGAGSAELALLARPDLFADALAGSTLGFGLGPLLFTDSDGSLSDAVEQELLRALPSGRNVYLLGGPAALPAELEDQLVGLGFVPARLAGSGREATAAAIAEEVVRIHGDGVARPPFGTVVLATGVAWPDAVLAGQLGSWWGFPILLTGPQHLATPTAELLGRLDLDEILVVGGPAAVPDSVLDEVAEIRPDVPVTRLAGASRIGTGLAVASQHLQRLAELEEPPPDAVVAVNVRRADAFAHVLSATPVMAATAALVVPIEADDGSVVAQEVVDLLCGRGHRLIVIGGRDLVGLSASGALRDALAGVGCSS